MVIAGISYVPMEELMKKVGSRYKLVVLASARTLELNDGKEKLVEVPPNTRLAAIALKEIQEGKISCKKRKEEKDKE